MTPTQKLQQIKNWLFSFSQQHSFARYMGEDGLEYEIDGEIEAAKELYAVSKEGMTQLAEDGTYRIDGRVLEVVKGIIQDVISGNRVLEPQINEETKKETMAENVKMVSDSLVDGTEVSISGDQIIAGATLKIVKDGQELLPPAGEHELKSGSVVVVDENGIITEIKPIEPKPEIEIELADEVAPEEIVKDTEDKDIKEMMKQVMEAVMEMKTKMGEMEEKQVKMKEEFSSFKKEPAAEPLKRNSNATNYQFGSGDNSRVRMINAMKGML